MYLDPKTGMQDSFWVFGLFSGRFLAIRLRSLGVQRMMNSRTIPLGCLTIPELLEGYEGILQEGI